LQFATIIKRKGLELVNICEGPKLKVMVDVLKLKQILINLVSNGKWRGGRGRREGENQMREGGGREEGRGGREVEEKRERGGRRDEGEEGGGPKLKVMVDVLKLKQILINLVSNAKWRGGRGRREEEGRREGLA
jgi:nitrogen fixation/metabolism regulation signal transduction histidine kinase